MKKPAWKRAFSNFGLGRTQIIAWSVPAWQIGVPFIFHDGHRNTSLIRRTLARARIH